MDDLRAQKLSKAQEIVSNKGFIKLPEIEQRKIVERMLQNGLHVDDLPLLSLSYNNLFFNTNTNSNIRYNSVSNTNSNMIPSNASLNKLGRDPLFSLIRHLDYKSINALCSTETYLYNFCYNNRAIIWNYLLARDFHLPLSLIPPGETSTGELRAKDYYLKRKEGGTAYATGRLAVFLNKNQLTRDEIMNTQLEYSIITMLPTPVKFNPEEDLPLKDSKTNRAIIEETKHNGYLILEERRESHRNMVKISAGIFYTALLDSNGIVYLIAKRGGEDYNLVLEDDNIIELLANKVKLFDFRDKNNRIRALIKYPFVDVTCYDNNVVLINNRGEVFFITGNNITANNIIPEAGLYISSIDGRYMTILGDNKLLKTIFPHKIVKCRLGNNHQVYLLSDERVIVMGNNLYGQLGLGDPSNEEGTNNHLNTHPNRQHKMQLLPGVRNIIDIAVAGDSTLLLDSNGVVYSFGQGKESNLGHGNTDNVYFPKPIQWFVDNGIKIVYIDIAEHSSGFIDDKGRVYMCGISKHGELGLPEVKNYARISVPTLVTLPNENLSSETLKTIQISCARYHTAILTTTGRLFTFGLASHGALGLDKDILEKLQAKKFLAQEKRLAHIKEVGDDRVEEIRERVKRNNIRNSSISVPTEVTMIYNKNDDTLIQVENVSWISCSLDSTFFIQ